MMPVHCIQKRISKIIAVVTAIAMMMSFNAFAEDAGSITSVSVKSAPVVTDSSAINGMVRVYLSSLGNPSSLTLTTVGGYAAGGKTFSGGKSIAIGFSSSTGAITLTYDGVKTNMGTFFTLQRQSASGTSGIKIKQAKEPNNAYPGDVSFRAVKSGGSYKLYTIAHVYIEDYLYGVLPYEMGNSTGIEALKAQAVAARTYTVRMMNARSGGYYDVVDTTNDQVYRGMPAGNANCVSAVNATKGTVLKYGSAYATTYYSASNGGQTESAKNLWGYTGYDYLKVKDDPFDYANASSTVKSKTVYKDLSSGMNSSSLISLLKSKAVSELTRKGYAANSGNVTLVKLTSVTPHTPMYGSPSRLYTKMDFGLNVKVNGSSATVTVTCDIFGELESTLSMSIQSSKNELWSVKTASDSFILQARRYGHGIGMSQRGAMYMSKLGYSYGEILGFYFDGCKLVRCSFTNSVVSGGSQPTVEDPEPPEESHGGCKGTVKLVSAGTSIAIRSSKSTSGHIIGIADNGAIMNVLANDGKWCFIKYGDIYGYLPANALSISGTPDGSEGTPTTIEGFAVVTANDFVNLRKSGSMGAPIVTTASNGAVMTVLDNQGAWARVQYHASVAYVNTNYVRFTNEYPLSVVAEGNSEAAVEPIGDREYVEMFSSASTNSKILAQVPSSSRVKVSADDGSWAYVSYNGTTGYMLSSCLNYDVQSGSAELPEAPPQETGSEPEDGGTVGISDGKSTIRASVGYLREKPDRNAASLVLIGRGCEVVLLSRGEEWCEVSFEDFKGYILASELNLPDKTETTPTSVAAPNATVTTASGSLNLRAEAKAGSMILTTIPRNARVAVTSAGAAWCAVSYNGISGFCMTSFLTLDEQAETAAPTPPTNTGEAIVATRSGSLNLRSEPRAGSLILRTIPQYARITVNSYGAEWCNVDYMGTNGYVMTVFLSFTSSDTDSEGSNDSLTPVDDNTPDNNYADENGENPDENDSEEQPTSEAPSESTLYATVSTASGSLNMRTEPLSGSNVIMRIPRGTTIAVSEKLSAWSCVSYGGQTGYVMNAYLLFAQNQNIEHLGDMLTAVVITPGGALNLRAEASVNAGVITQIPQYAEVEVEQRGDAWCYLRYGTAYGYAMTSFLTFNRSGSAERKSTVEESQDNDEDLGDSPEQNENIEPESAHSESAAYVQTPGGTLNLRESANGSAPVLTVMPLGAQIKVLQYGEDWCMVEYGGYEGYAATSFLRFDKPVHDYGEENQSDDEQTAETSAETPDLSQEPETVWVSTPSSNLNMRVSPDENSNVMFSLKPHTKLSRYYSNDGWSYVEYNGSLGYVRSKYLSEDEPQQYDEETETRDDNQQHEDGEEPIEPNPEQSTAPKEPNGEICAIVDPPNGETHISLMEERSELSGWVIDVPKGETVQLLLADDEWCLVQYKTNFGYCRTDSITVVE